MHGRRDAYSAGLIIWSEFQFSSLQETKRVCNGKINCSLVCVKSFKVSDIYFWTQLNMAPFDDIGKVSLPNKSSFRVIVVYCDTVWLRLFF